MSAGLDKTTERRVIARRPHLTLPLFELFEFHDRSS
jgi:hypothetical protein